MNRFDSAFGYLETGGWVISAFSILIGVFSIGMIMYISVRERTNEIGVQKALGSTKSFILYQFVMEAILICLIGGMIGLGIVFGLGALVEVGLQAMELDIEVITAQSTIMIAIFLSAGSSSPCHLLSAHVEFLLCSRRNRSPGAPDRRSHQRAA